jgi:ribosomal protein S18 acetylase RimI-like enzyme
MTVRLATPDDADAIERIRTDTWRDAYRGLMPDALLDGLSYDATRRRAAMRVLRPDRFVLVAEHDGVVGFCVGGPERFGVVPHPEIYAIYVLPAHQGHGHGAALLGAGARELVARGARAMQLWVLRENAAARGFYERMGGRHLTHHDTERDIEGVRIVEACYVWDDIAALTGR